MKNYKIARNSDLLNLIENSKETEIALTLPKLDNLWQTLDITLLLYLSKKTKIYLKGYFEDADLARFALYNIITRQQYTAKLGTKKCNIYVKDYLLETSVGAYAYEHKIKQTLIFNIVAEVFIAENPKKLTDVFSYDIIIDAIKLYSKFSHTELLEEIAENICNFVILQTPVQRISIRIGKLGLINGSVEIELTKQKN